VGKRKKKKKKKNQRENASKPHARPTRHGPLPSGRAVDATEPLIEIGADREGEEECR
jgi:hypothetical protein